MKNRIQGIIIGFLVAALLLGGTALAIVGTKNITVTYRDIKLVVDGKEVIPRDVNGNVVEPFIYEGTTYLPIRAISQALGKPVDWDNPTSTVYVGEKPDTGTSSGEQPYKAAFITQAMSNPSQKFSWDEFQRIAPEYGFEMHIFAGENEPAVEIHGIETCIAGGFDAIFINPSSIEAIIPALVKAREAGIVVGMFVSELPPEWQHLRSFFCGFDDYIGGILVGQYVSSQFLKGANFVEVGGHAGHEAQIKRSAGFRDGIANNIIELDAQNCPGGWNSNEALAIMEDFLVKYGDKIDIVWCHWDHGATAVIEAVQNAGYKPGSGPGEIYIIGVDGGSIGFQQVKEGTQALSVGYSYTNLVRKSLENARTMLDGGTVETQSIIPMDMVTRGTIDTLVWPRW